jgi:hypothetical protein
LRISAAQLGKQGFPVLLKWYVLWFYANLRATGSLSQNGSPLKEFTITHA